MWNHLPIEALIEKVVPPYGTPGVVTVSPDPLIDLASPPCHECGAPVQRVENRWHLDEDGRWRLGPCFMVCAGNHRVLVEALA